MRAGQAQTGQPGERSSLNRCFASRTGRQINDPAEPSKKIDDYWGPSQLMLGDATFMSQLKEYDKVWLCC